MFKKIVDKVAAAAEWVMVTLDSLVRKVIAIATSVAIATGIITPATAAGAAVCVGAIGVGLASYCKGAVNVRAAKFLTKPMVFASVVATVLFMLGFGGIGIGLFLSTAMAVSLDILVYGARAYRAERATEETMAA